MTPNDATPPQSTERADGVPVVAPVGPVRPSRRAIGVWVLLVGAAVALDGLVGGLALVVVAAVLLAGFSTRILGAVGVLCLLLTPVALIVDGIPEAQEISPGFVTRSLLPHHLTFAGLVFVCAFALIDLAPHLRAWASSDRPPQDDGPPLGRVAGAVVVVAVAIGSIVACMAVLGA